MKVKEGYAAHNIAGRWMVISVQDGAASFSELFELNKEGYLLWRMLEQGSDHNALVSRLTNEYPDITPQQAQQDVDTFLDSVRALSLLEE